MGYNPKWVAEQREQKRLVKAAAKLREKGVPLADLPDDQRKAFESYMEAALEGEAESKEQQDEEVREDESDAEGDSEEDLGKTIRKPKKLNKQAALDAAEYQGGPVQTGTSRKPITRTAKKSANPGGQ